MIFRKEYTYNDISLFSRQVSTINSRFTDDIDINVEVRFGVNLKKVGFLMSAPMYDVTGYEMMISLLEQDHLPIVHRFMTSSEQLKMFMDVVRYFNFNKDKIYSYSLGINDCESKLEYLSKFLDETELKQKNDLNILICIDTANGANNLLLKPLKLIKEFKERHKEINVEVLSGNIVTKEASKFLYNNGVKFQRVSISTGSACSTSVVTGIYRPPVSTIMEIFEQKEIEGFEDLYIIADGGFKETSDMIKAIAVGADFIMSGNLFAGYKESNSPLLVSSSENGFGYKEVSQKTPSDYFNYQINLNGILGLNNMSNYYFKHYRGMASEAMATINNKVNNIDKKILAEGVSSIIKYKYNLNDDIDNIVNSFKSSMSYSNARNFDEFRAKIEVVEISNNSLIQRKPHV
jgi:IMP dehydrogenase